MKVTISVHQKQHIESKKSSEGRVSQYLYWMKEQGISKICKKVLEVNKMGKSIFEMAKDLKKHFLIKKDNQMAINVCKDAQHHLPPRKSKIKPQGDPPMIPEDVNGKG